jgi:hypothetical protein
MGRAAFQPVERFTLRFSCEVIAKYVASMLPNIPAVVMVAISVLPVCPEIIRLVFIG